MSKDPSDKEYDLSATVGDVLFSRYRIPNPGAILLDLGELGMNIHARKVIDFRQLQNFLELLEYVVLTERLIVPVPEYAAATERMMADEVLGVEFYSYGLRGELSFTTEDVIDLLNEAGVLHEAKIRVGSATSDELIEKLLPTSKSLQRHFNNFVKYAEKVWPTSDKVAIAKAKMAVWVGSPLHVAEAAGLARTPFVIGPTEEEYIGIYERENLRLRNSVGKILLDRLNAGAKQELSRLTQLGVICSFPETPIASMILHNASTPSEMVSVALQLRTEFSSFRKYLNQIEYDLANEDQPLKSRLKRVDELEKLGASLWPNTKTEFKTAALGVVDAMFAIPELATAPTPLTIKKLIDRISSIPLDVIINVARRRKIRLLLKAKRTFLRNRNATARIARIFNVSEEIVKRSQLEMRRLRSTT